MSWRRNDRLPGSRPRQGKDRIGTLEPGIAPASRAAGHRGRRARGGRAAGTCRHFPHDQHSQNRGQPAQRPAQHRPAHPRGQGTLGAERAPPRAEPGWGRRSRLGRRGRDACAPDCRSGCHPTSSRARSCGRGRADRRPACAACALRAVAVGPRRGRRDRAPRRSRPLRAARARAPLAGNGRARRRHGRGRRNEPNAGKTQPARKRGRLRAGPRVSPCTAQRAASSRRVGKRASSRCAAAPGTQDARLPRPGPGSRHAEARALRPGNSPAPTPAAGLPRAAAPRPPRSMPPAKRTQRRQTR